MSKQVIDCRTGEIIERDLTPEEIAQETKDNAERQAALAAIQEELAAKEAARQAILDKLGLTSEEAKILLS